MSELKPCPWCNNAPYADGGTAKVFGKRTMHNYAIACSYCEASAPGARTMTEALSEWNTRATTTLTAAMELPEIKALVKGAKWAKSALAGLPMDEATTAEMDSLITALRALEPKL